MTVSVTIVHAKQRSKRDSTGDDFTVTVSALMSASQFLRDSDNCTGDDSLTVRAYHLKSVIKLNKPASEFISLPEIYHW
jgi:hypothetical protein